MLTLTGQLLTVIHRPSRTLRDGRVTDAYQQVQLAIREALDDGQVRHDILTMSLSDARPYVGLNGKTVQVPVRAYVKGGGVAYVINGDPQVVE